MHRITSPEALRLTRLVVAAEWQVTLVLLSMAFTLGLALLPKKPDVCVCPAVPGGHSFRGLLAHDFTLRK